MLHFIEGLTDV